MDLAKGFTNPIISAIFTETIPDDVMVAHETLSSKRKVTLLLRSKALAEPSIQIGYLVQVYPELHKDKRGKWISSRFLPALKNLP